MYIYIQYVKEARDEPLEVVAAAIMNNFYKLFGKSMLSS
jgi:Tat protein secretion system quality control protein TatD with DNase activity